MRGARENPMRYTGKFQTSSPDRYLILKNFAQQNRRNPTMAECVLWENLRAGRLDGRKFYRQHIIADYIVDFLCHDDGLVIEVDGAYHLERDQIDSDEQRTQHLERLGYRVIRFTNEEVIDDIESVLETIRNELK